MVGVPGFEPGASWTRTKRDTKLRHTPIATYDSLFIISSGWHSVKENFKDLLLTPPNGEERLFLRRQVW